MGTGEREKRKGYFISARLFCICFSLPFRSTSARSATMANGGVMAARDNNSQSQNEACMVSLATLGQDATLDANVLSNSQNQGSLSRVFDVNDGVSELTS